MMMPRALAPKKKKANNITMAHVIMIARAHRYHARLMLARDTDKLQTNIVARHGDKNKIILRACIFMVRMIMMARSCIPVDVNVNVNFDVNVDVNVRDD